MEVVTAQSALNVAPRSPVRASSQAAWWPSRAQEEEDDEDAFLQRMLDQDDDDDDEGERPPARQQQRNYAVFEEDPDFGAAPAREPAQQDERGACTSSRDALSSHGIAAFSNVALVDFRTSTAAASASHSLMPTDDASTSTEPAAAAVDQHRAILPPFTARAFDGSTVTIRRRARRSQAQVLGSHKQQRVHSAQLVRRNGGGKAQVAATQAQAQGGDGGESLATTPFHRLLESIKSEWEAARVAKEEESLRKPPSALEHALFHATAATAATETQMWTDRYRPTKFTELVGDERVHRAALLWLKDWDACVFRGTFARADVGANARKAREREKRRKRARDQQAAWGGGAARPAGGAYGADDEQEPDRWGRPNERILLLSGPPGLGKTTLAHVLARQAGYNTIEVNASDDRSGKVVEDRIRNSVESVGLSAGVLHANNKAATIGVDKKRPFCVVIDEIDGAGGGGENSFVKMLVRLVTEGNSPKRFHRGKGKEAKPLLRPIICICNDLYAPVLRPLRPMARIIRFNAPTNLMLSKRLTDICTLEGLKIDSRNMSLLIELSHGDLRSCLNTLQFIRRRSRVVDESTIKSASIGSKDSGTSPSAVWDRLFRRTNPKQAQQTADRYVERLVRDVQTCGEYDKLVQGCFETYLHAKLKSEGWDQVAAAHEWLQFYDLVDTRLRTDRDYDLMAYMPYAFVPWYPLFASVQNKPVEYPKVDYEAYQKRVAHHEIVDAFTAKLPYQIKNLFTGSHVVDELLPLLNRIIRPDLRPVNSQLIKAEDKITMSKLVDTMISFDLAFVQDKDESGQVTYKTEPPIDVFIHYEGKRADNVAASRYALRHLVAKEIEAEKIRRANKLTPEDQKSAAQILSAYKKTTAADGVKPETKDAVDFFGRKIVVHIDEGAEDDEPPPPKKRRCVYKYHEGFSNAVRVHKRIEDFM